MCGFAGIITWDERHRIQRDTLQKMSARIAHRGPDGEGIYLSPDAPITPTRPQIALAHRRLAILDPDPRANQPFTDMAGRWIVFNGEIYNFLELHAELSKLQPNYAWRTRCDTEVLLVAYAQWGDECVRHLNGMFAFAIWDEPKETLFFARDPMGQKPFYYCMAPGNQAVAFGSEIGALLPVPWFDGAIDAGAIVEYLRNGYISSGSIYRDIKTVSPGSTIRFTHGITQGTYFNPNEVVSDQSHNHASTRDRVLKAVRRQLVSDVPIGCFLSGGMDSSIIAAAMKASLSNGQQVSTFSIGFDDQRYDETPYAAAVAKYLGTTHREFIVKPDAAADLLELSRVFGEPFGDSSALPTHYLARETRKHVKVALSGDGGDELFGGYDRYRAMHLAARIDSLPSVVATAARSTLWQRLPGSHPKSRLARFKRFQASLCRKPADRYAGYMTLFDDALLSELLKDDLLQASSHSSDYPGLASQYEAALKGCPTLHIPPRDPVQAALAVDRVTYLPSDLLTKVDRASMLHALEVRSPFMDPELVHFAAGLSTSQLIQGGPKRLLREAFANDLPAWVFKRKKMGFAVPIGDWFRGELRAMLTDYLFATGSFSTRYFNRSVVQRLVDEHEGKRFDHSQRLYAILMLEVWWTLQNDLHRS